MNKTTPHNSHRFIANIFGSAGYAAMVFIWLLAIQVIVLLIPSASIESVFSAVGSSLLSDTSSVQSAAQDPAALRFLLVIALIAVTWGFIHYGSLAVSAFMRSLLRLCRVKVTVHSLMTAKYIVSASALALTAVLALLLPNELSADRLAIAILGFTSGLIALGATWAQYVVATRHRLAVSSLR